MASGIPTSLKKEITDAWKAEATWKACLLKNTYTFDATDVLYADVSAQEITGTGYTAGGKQILAADKTSSITGTDYVLSSASVAWTAATFINPARFVVLYETVSGANGKIRAIIDLGADYTVTAGTFTITWSASGLIKVSSI